MASLPNLFLIGAPKSGTSALFAALCQHPQIRGGRLKEPHYFGEDLGRLNGRRFTLAEYRDLFAGPPSRYLIDGSTSYLFSQGAPAEVAAAVPDPRALVILRDPVEVIHAMHAEMVAGGFETIVSFQDALDAEPDRIAGHRLPNRRGLRENLYYRRLVRFDKHLERWFSVLGRSRVHVMFFDDWRTNPHAVFDEIVEFLGAEPFKPNIAIVNPNRRVRWQRAHQLIFEPPAALRRVARLAFPASIRNRAAHRLGRMNTRVASRAELPESLEAQLRAEFTPHTLRLEALLGRDLTSWRHPSPTTPAPSARDVQPATRLHKPRVQGSD